MPGPDTRIIAQPTDGGGRARPDIVSALGQLLLSDCERARAHAVRARLLYTLCGRASNVAMVALAFLTCGTAAWVRDGFGPAPLIAFVGFALIAWRCTIIRDVRKRYDAGLITAPDRDLIPFAVTAIASSLCWGLLTFVVMTGSHDAVLTVIVMMSCIGTAGSVAARNAGAPRVAKIMLIVSLAPVMAASVFAVDRGFVLFLVLIPAMTAGLFILIDEANEQLVELFEMQIVQSLLSKTDPLTQVSNRRHFDETIAAAVANAKLSNRPLAVLMIDVDHFKTFNDRHGHLAGDVCLQATATVLRQNLRTGDLVFRYGGEEFALILENANGAEAEAVANRLREAVASTVDGGRQTVTISIGIATTDDIPLEAAALIGAADAALYQAKDDGRNRVARSAGPRRDRAA